MSGWADERAILEGWFQKQWKNNPAPNNTAGVDVAYTGQVYDTPQTGAEWMAMDIISPTEGTQIELGTPALNRYVGIIQFTISVPIGRGGGASQRAREIADALEKLWKHRRFQKADGTRIRCRVPGYKVIGEQTDMRFVAVLSVPYLRDEFATVPDVVMLP
jgi:hypothetical protein